MQFPLRDSSRWDPTQFINPDTEVTVGTEQIEPYLNWSGRVLELGKSEQVGAFSFDRVLTCLQADDDNGIERRYVLEKYAHGVGLVYRVDTILDSRCKRLGILEPCLVINNNVNPPDTTCQPWVTKAEKGYILRQEILNFN